MNRVQGASAPPFASVIVPFLDGSPWLAGCLESLQRNASTAVPHEIIVIANGAAIPPELADARRGVRVLSSGVNLGFGGGCNWAAEHAQGRYLVFLNDDTTVEAGWLDALVAAAESEPEAAAFGSLVIGDAGRVEEAGRVMWRDGASHGIAAGLPVTSLELPRRREVDYCSGCALLVRRTAWEAVGGFDERYFPAYYEDADLGLELRRRGWAVVCVSDSRVRHRRSVSTTKLWRRFLGLRNHALFVAKWRPALAEFPERPRDQPSRREVEQAAAGACGRRAAVHQKFRPPAGIGPAERLTRLGRDLTHLQAALELKDEYIAQLEASAPELERRLDRLLQKERRRSRLREAIRAVPVFGDAAVWLRRRRRA